MKCDKVAALLDPSAQLSDSLYAQDGLGGSISHKADYVGMKDLYLGLKIMTTLVDFIFLRLSILRGAALDNAGYKHI